MSKTDVTAVEEKDKPITRKERVIQAQGKEVGLDLFLYSCLEHERLLRYNPDHIANHITWPLLSETLESNVKDVQAMALPGLIQRLTNWYRDEFPSLASTKVLDHEHLNEVLAQIVALNRDLGKLHKLKTGQNLPEYEKPKDGTETVWNDIERSLKSSLPTYAHLINRYAQWSHAVEPLDEFEPGSRPPVGRYAPRLPRDARDVRGRDSGPRGARDGGPPRGRDGGGSRDRPPPRREGAARERPRDDDDGRDVTPREAMAPAPQETRESSGADEGSEGRGPRGPRRDRGDRDRGDRDRGDRDRGDRDSARRDRGPRRGREGALPDSQLEAAALAEVDSAIEQLKSNTGVDEVTLKPNNSFYRRIQHQKAVDAGYTSFSVGEGPDRAVKVSRKE